jgi:diguanylate cyclase (GGDEF)-like protein
MTKDIRYSELVFLREVGKGDFEYFTTSNQAQLKAVGLPSLFYAEMVAALIEELYIQFDNPEMQMFVARLRGELGQRYNTSPSRTLPDHYWDNPRDALSTILSGVHGAARLRITYRGLRRIEELRGVLRNERILEPFTVLLSMQYFLRDLEDSLRAGIDVPVSVLYCDMDNFKRINTQFGQKAGDVVMESYLKVVRDSLGCFGEGYRGVGDEVAAIVVGQGHQQAVDIAETIRKEVEAMRCEYNGKPLPPVTVSIGLATTPPETRNADIEIVAESRKQQAKDKGKNRLIDK